MDTDEYEEDGLLIAAACLLLTSSELHKKKKQGKKRSCWAFDWLLRRPEYGQYEKLMGELLREDPAGFQNFVRVTPDMFQELLHRLGPRIEKQDTFMRKALEPGLKLAVTLRYLATGDSYQSLKYGFRVGDNTISGLVVQTCQAILDELEAEFMPMPSTPEQWKKIADNFSTRWNFHNVVGAIDGKHVAIRCPNNTGSYYWNYKKFYSIVLLAIVDAGYKFIYTDIGSNGANSDAGIFRDSQIFKLFEEGRAGLPPPQPFPGSDKRIPFHLIGDDAFALREWLMKPFPQRGMLREERLFNYRLSRARRVVENAFGILSHRFRCLLTTMQQQPENVIVIVAAACVLHNYILTRNPILGPNAVDHEDPVTLEVRPGDWHAVGELTPLQALRGNTGLKVARKQREFMMQYYTSDVGAVSWQERATFHPQCK